MSSGTVSKVRTFKADLEAARKNSRATTNEMDVNMPAPDSTTTPKTLEKSVVPPVQSEPKAVEPALITAAEPIIEPTIIEPVATEPDLEPLNIEPKLPIVKLETVVEDKEAKVPHKPESVKPIEFETDLPKNDTPETEGESEAEVFDSGISEGTIVSNKRVGHYGLFRALGDNYSGWRAKHKQKAVAKEAAKPKISAAESRIETLKQAAKGSYRAPQSDHGILLKQLKKRKPTEAASAKSNIVVKKKEEVPEPTWAHIVGEEKIVTPEVTTVPTKPEETVTATPPPVAITKETKPEEEKKLTVVSETVPTSETTAAAPTEEKEKISPRPISVYQWPTHKPAESKVEEVEEEKSQASLAATEEVVPAKKEVEEKITPVQKPTAAETKATPKTGRSQFIFRIAIIGVLLIVVTGAIGGGVWYVFQPSTPTEYIDISTTPSQQLLRSDNDYTVSLSTGTSNIYDTVYNHMVESRSLTTHTFLTDDGALAEPQTVVEALAFRMPGSFARALTDITIGSIDGTEPFIILRATNFDTAFAGMLTWENSLSSDVSPLFGDPVVESFDPSARTDTGLRPAFYADAVVANTSVRILRDSANTSRIIYGFANPNTIIITTDESAYESLLDRARN